MRRVVSWLSQGTAWRERGGCTRTLDTHKVTTLQCDLQTDCRQVAKKAAAQSARVVGAL